MRWLAYINGLLLLLLVTAACSLFWLGSKEAAVPVAPPLPEPVTLSPFAPIGAIDWERGALALKEQAPSIQLPDLRGELLYYGRNERPDVPQGAFIIGLSRSDAVQSVPRGARIYLTYQPPGETPSSRTNAPKGHYTFSPGNRQSALWIQLIAEQEPHLTFSIHMRNEKGEEVRDDPLGVREVVATRQETRGNGISWEIGNLRVDGTLLARQRARWMGRDCFLERHGGKEFAHVAGKERIDFYDVMTSYPCFVGLGDFLIWKGEHWVTPAAEEPTASFPLLQVKQLDDKVMALELWDPSGRNKVALNLVRTRDPVGTLDPTRELTFIGAKTWAQFTLASRNGTRFTVRSHDWLLLGQEGWTLIDSATKVDDYVEGRLLGPLLVIDTLSKQNGHRALLGHIFNISRTEVEEVQWVAHNEMAAIPLPAPFASGMKTEVDNKKEE